MDEEIRCPALKGYSLWPVQWDEDTITPYCLTTPGRITHEITCTIVAGHSVALCTLLAAAIQPHEGSASGHAGHSTLTRQNPCSAKAETIPLLS